MESTVASERKTLILGDPNEFKKYFMTATMRERLTAPTERVQRAIQILHNVLPESASFVCPKFWSGGGPQPGFVAGLCDSAAKCHKPRIVGFEDGKAIYLATDEDDVRAWAGFQPDDWIGWDTGLGPRTGLLAYAAPLVSLTDAAPPTRLLEYIAYAADTMRRNRPHPIESKLFYPAYAENRKSAKTAVKPQKSPDPEPRPVPEPIAPRSDLHAQIAAISMDQAEAIAMLNPISTTLLLAAAELNRGQPGGAAYQSAMRILRALQVLLAIPDFGPVIPPPAQVDARTRDALKALIAQL